MSPIIPVRLAKVLEFKLLPFSRKRESTLYLGIITMDPFTVTTGCIGLLAGVAQLSVQIATFVSSVKHARRDMDAVLRELASLSLCLGMLRDNSRNITYPDGFRDNLMNVLENCNSVTNEMEAMLLKLSSTNLGRRLQWTFKEKGEMDRLRSSLESHKSALEIALDMTSL